MSDTSFKHCFFFSFFFWEGWSMSHIKKNKYDVSNHIRSTNWHQIYEKQFLYNDQSSSSSVYIPYILMNFITSRPQSVSSALTDSNWSRDNLPINGCRVLDLQNKHGLFPVIDIHLIYIFRYVNDTFISQSPRLICQSILPN